MPVPHDLLARSSNNEKYHQSERVEWWLQSFQSKDKSKSGYSKTDITKVNKHIGTHSRSKLLQASFGYKSLSDSKKFKQSASRGCFVNTFSIKNWLTSESVKEIILQEISDEIISLFAIQSLPVIKWQPHCIFMKMTMSMLACNHGTL